MGSGLVIGFIEHLLLESSNQSDWLSHYKSRHTASSQSCVTSLRDSTEPWIFHYSVFTIRFLATDFSRGTITVTLPISLYYSTRYVFSSQTDLQVSTILHSIILMPLLHCFHAHILACWHSKRPSVVTLIITLHGPEQKTQPFYIVCRALRSNSRQAERRKHRSSVVGHVCIEGFA
jgi:hypothetical protein